jgi:hypothetical protein
MDSSGFWILYTFCQSAWHCCEKIPEINNFREEGFILTQRNFRSLVPLLELVSRHDTITGSK